MDYNKLAVEIHQAQKEAGWYDEYRSDNTLILLIKSEVFEAFEAYRKNPKILALSEGYLDSLSDMIGEVNGLFIERFREHVKDGFADELADVTIRLLDFAVYKEMTLGGELEEFVDRALIDALIDVDYSLGCLYYGSHSPDEFIFKLIQKVQHIADSCKIDLGRHIKLKLAYNQTRSKRHGNKAV